MHIGLQVHFYSFIVFKCGNNIIVSTADSSVTNAVAMPQFISILGVHSGLDKAGVVKSLPWSLQAQEVWVYLDHGLAVVQLLMPLSASVLAKVVFPSGVY